MANEAQRNMIQHPMMHRIEAFDSNTGELVFAIDIPPHHNDALADLMGWIEPEDRLRDYDLGPDQLKQLEQLLSRTFHDKRYDYQLGSYTTAQ